MDPAPSGNDVHRDPRDKWPLIALAIGVVPLFASLTFDILSYLFFPWIALPSDWRPTLHSVLTAAFLIPALYVAIYPILALGYAIKRAMASGWRGAAPALISIPLWGLCVAVLIWEWQTAEILSFFYYEDDRCADRIMTCWLAGSWVCRRFGFCG